jgi:uncharacterized protein (DUF983 family)
MPSIFRSIVTLRCPHCLQSRLRKENSWFDFKEGCKRCNYRYEREEGYFLGAPWMINYPLTSVISIAAGVYFYRYTEIHSSALAALLSVIAIGVGAFFYPYARAIWMVGDHIIHPLQDKDRLDFQLPLTSLDSRVNKT